MTRSPFRRRNRGPEVASRSLDVRFPLGNSRLATRRGEFPGADFPWGERVPATIPRVSGARAGRKTRNGKENKGPRDESGPGRAKNSPGSGDGEFLEFRRPPHPSARAWRHQSGIDEGSPVDRIFPPKFIVPPCIRCHLLSLFLRDTTRRSIEGNSNALYSHSLSSISLRSTPSDKFSKVEENILFLSVKLRLFENLQKLKTRSNSK